MKSLETLRNKMRDYRLFYSKNSRALFQGHLERPGQALLLPLGRKALLTTGGQAIDIPRKYFFVLPAVLRLGQYGARVEWAGEEMKIQYQGLTLFAPPARFISTLFKGIFLDNVWRAQGQDLKDSTVVDVGGYLGFFSVLSASLGARVHVFEPFKIFSDFITRNVQVNGYGDRVTVHAYGLSDCASTIVDPAELGHMASDTHGFGGDSARVRNALEVFQALALGDVALLKMNCEGCEYALLKDGAVLDLLRPRRVAMECHEGSDHIIKVLKATGYEVLPQTTVKNDGPGLAFAARR